MAEVATFAPLAAEIIDHEQHPWEHLPDQEQLLRRLKLFIAKADRAGLALEELNRDGLAEVPDDLAARVDELTAGMLELGMEPRLLTEWVASRHDCISTRYDSPVQVLLDYVFDEVLEPLQRSRTYVNGFVPAPEEAREGEETTCPSN